MLRADYLEGKIWEKLTQLIDNPSHVGKYVIAHAASGSMGQVDRLEEVRSLQSRLRKEARFVANHIARARTKLARESLEAELEQLGDRLETLTVEESELVSNIHRLESNKLDIGAPVEALERLGKGRRQTLSPRQVSRYLLIP